MTVVASFDSRVFIIPEVKTYRIYLKCSLFCHVEHFNFPDCDILRTSENNISVQSGAATVSVEAKTTPTPDISVAVIVNAHLRKV
jgi:hypothetical protein